MPKGINFFALCILSQLTLTFSRHCPRDMTRVVRDVLKEKVYPLYKQINGQIPDKCSFSQERDMYLLQEENKVSEGLSRWYCDFCGKGFYSEAFLDQHFDNRHSEYTRKDKNSVCFADFCDIMRCDILAGHKKKLFWDVSLCMEDDMKELAEDCEKLMSSCVPGGLSKNATEYLIGHLTEGICSYLTCKRYWESPDDENSDSGIAYIVFTVFLGIILVIYYCVAYHYFYTDTFSDGDRYYDQYHPVNSLTENKGSRKGIIEDLNVNMS